MEPVPADLFSGHLDEVRRRTEAALARAGFDGLVIASGLPPMQYADDQPYPFKPNPQFGLWVPDPQPGCLVAFVPGCTPVLVFYQPDDFWHLPPEAPREDWIRHFDLRVVRRLSDLSASLPPAAKLAVLGSAEPAWAGIGEPNPAALVRALDFERAAKTAYEIECMARANRLAARAHRAAERAFRAGASEYEVHMAYCRAALMREQELPYNNIIAFDRHAAVLHYQRLERTRPPEVHSLLIDAGAPFAGYASDVTRTYAARDGQFGDLVERLDSIQQELAGKVRPGSDYRDIHLEAHEAIGRLLTECGLVRTRPEDAVERGLTSLFFPHGIGHLLGLQVHDVGGLMADAGEGERPRPAGHPYLRLTRDLPEGCAVTIEPGLYFIDALLAEAAADDRHGLIDWELVNALRPCGGIRIEDNVVATARGPRNLTREAFAELD